MTRRPDHRHSSATVHSYGFTPSGVGDRPVTEFLSIVTRWYTGLLFKDKKRRRSSDTAAVAFAAAALGYISIQ
eukprot:scaffold60214_cov57-Phaeocystis_antarctica.AAC.1